MSPIANRRSAREKSGAAKGIFNSELQAPSRESSSWFDIEKVWVQAAPSISSEYDFARDRRRVRHIYPAFDTKRGCYLESRRVWHIYATSGTTERECLAY